MAVYGDFIDYTEIPPEIPGQPVAYQFNRASGPSVKAFGQPAEELRKRLDAANAARSSQMLANANQPSFADINAGNVPPEPPPSRLDAGGGLGAGPAAPPPAPTPASAPPQKEVASAPRAAPPLALNKQGDIIDPSTGEVTVKPRGGTKGGPIETGRTQRGGFDPDEAYLEQQETIAFKQKLANQIGYEAQMEESASQQGRMQADIDAAERARLDAEAEAAAVEERVAKNQKVYDEASARYKSSKIDPNRARDPLGVIGAILGTLGATLPGGKENVPNYALDIFNKRIDDDIRAQETELNVKRDAAQNALGDLERQLGSRALAKTALRSIMSEKRQAQVALEASREKNLEKKAQLDQTQLLVDKQVLDNREQYLRASEGEVTRQIKNVQPVAGSAGGKRPATIAEQSAALGLEEKKQGLQQGEAGLRKTEADIKKTEAETKKTEAAATGAGKLTASAAGMIANIEASQDQLLSMWEKDESAKYPVIIRKEGGIGASPFSKGHSKRSDVLSQLLPKAYQGDTAGLEAMERSRKSLSSTSGEDRQAGYQASWDLLEAKKRAILNNPSAAESTAAPPAKE